MPARPNLSYDQNGNPYEGGPMKLINANNAGVAISLTPTFLHTINVTKAGTGWNMKLYDALDATDASKLIADMDCNVVGSFQFYGECRTALFAVISGTTPGALTIAFSDQFSY
jgi:hypothetical protein